MLPAVNVADLAELVRLFNAKLPDALWAKILKQADVASAASFTPASSINSIWKSLKHKLSRSSTLSACWAIDLTSFNTHSDLV